jgi:hypothetical protein
MTSHRFPYVEADPLSGIASALPYMPITLVHGKKDVVASAIVDSGATLNVLPYALGVQLGGVWEQQTVPVQLSGNLAISEARAFILTGQVAEFKPVRLAFAWSRNNDVPVILGQVNFFMEFDVLFGRSQLLFEIRDKGSVLR